MMFAEKGLVAGPDESSDESEGNWEPELTNDASEAATRAKSADIDSFEMPVQRSPDDGE